MERTNLRRHLSESAIVQNPTLGAYGLWKFGLSFQAQEGKQAILPLTFLVLPLVLHRPTLELIVSTQKGSGLALFAAKLGERREDLLAVHDRVLMLRRLTLQSIGFGVTAKLMSINYDEATIRSNSQDSLVKAPTLPERIKWLAGATDKLGHWFSTLTPNQIALTLKVDF